MTGFVWATLALSFFTSSVSATSPAPKAGPEAFNKPPAASRPLFRYWLPDASAAGSTVVADISRADNVGAGGVEFIPFYQYGGDAGGVPPGADWTKYGYGTRPFLELFRQALEAHKSHGMTMDFPLGPNQGQGVPAESENEGLQWDLVPFSAPVPSSGFFGHQIPGWGSGELISLVSATIKSRSVGQGSAYNYTVLVVEESTITSLSDQVSPDGKLTRMIPQGGQGKEQWVFAFYQRRSLRKNLHYDDNEAASIMGNGSYTVDHFSARGALTTIRFWQKHILSDGLKSLLKDTAGAAWEDSPEIVSNISWTRDMPQVFEKLHGYDIRPYLPLIMWGNNNLAIQAANPGRVRAILDTPDRGQGVINDYRAALEAGYHEYITTLKNWLNHELGVSFRAQVSYNLPMDMAVHVPSVDIPEVESLGFYDSPDAYRQYTGASVLAGKRVVSNELGAVMGSAYSYKLPALLHSANLGFVANVNKFVVHGQSYSGNYYNTTWPGHTPFQYAFSDAYSNKQPSWEHGMADAMEYLARVQHMMQSGLAKLDVAVYNKVSATDLMPPKDIYSSTDLSDDGYTYAYLTPGNFKLPRAVVKNKVLAPDTGSFRALVLPDGSSITHEAVKDLIRFSKAGLPIIIVGRPVYYPSNRKGDEARTWTAFKLLQGLPSVYMTKAGHVAKTLRSIGVVPAVGIKSEGKWLHSRRHDAVNGLDAVFILGGPRPSAGHIEVTLPGTPYTFDPWTGMKEPILHYTNNPKTQMMSIPLALAANETKIIVFSTKPLKDMALPKSHITQLPQSIKGYQYNAKAGLELRVVSSPSPETLYLNNGVAKRIEASGVPAAIQLKNWVLTAEHWEAPSNLSDASEVASKRNTTHQLAAPLKSWTELGSELADASGVGYYESSFTWPPASGADGAYIKFSPALHAMTIWVNGKRVAPLNYNRPIADIGPLLRKGQNQVLAVVPTTMWNYLKSILSELWCAGSPPLVVKGMGLIFPPPARSENGLLGNVCVTPYRNVVVKI
ncbi:hypothetical protein NW755_009726 [Fusarium falciforme]|uniref:Secreted protein n=1 Tax=Fusarium falciforme TaxID=195108 RepID=A0A9W8R2F0_9HYPO|nr:hypothetical protein NW755_009726 [Fusarium falciforme]KAJ4238283.1 hypothetical protein NW757_013177 [Fusarium falciforme]